MRFDCATCSNTNPMAPAQDVRHHVHDTPATLCKVRTGACGRNPAPCSDCSGVAPPQAHGLRGAAAGCNHQQPWSRHAALWDRQSGLNTCGCGVASVHLTQKEVRQAVPTCRCEMAAWKDRRAIGGAEAWGACVVVTAETCVHGKGGRRSLQCRATPRGRGWGRLGRPSGGDGGVCNSTPRANRRQHGRCCA